MINFNNLKDIYEVAIGIKLYKEFGEIETAPKGERTTDVRVGVFRINPSQLTALTDPFIGTVTAEIEIVCPPSLVDQTVKKLNEVASQKNGTSFKVNDGQTHYTVTYNCQTCSVGSLARVGWFSGKVYPVRQIITYSIIEKGIASNDVKLKLDGWDVPFLTMTETRVSSISNYTDSTAISRSANDSESFGVDFSVPYLDNTLGEILKMALVDIRGNKAHSVEIKKNGESKCYIMCIANIQDSVQPPLNVGFNVSLVEIDEMVAQFAPFWQEGTTTTAHAVLNTYTGDGVVYWGDGTGSRAKGTKVHVYTDDLKSHKIRFVPDNPPLYRDVAVNDVLLGKKIYCSAYSLTMYTGSSKELIKTMDGTTPSYIKFDSTSGRTAMINSNPSLTIAIDDRDETNNYYIKLGEDNAFQCIIKGKVTEINGSASFKVNQHEV